MKDFFKSPKKQRKSGLGSRDQDKPAIQAVRQAEPEVAAGEEVGGNAEDDDVHPAVAAPVEAVTDAARAFRHLHVRPARSGVEHSRARSPGAQPRSPKKRKATVNIDKEFILKDDKVKRNTALQRTQTGRLAADQQGDISQARGKLGQLLFEFGQLELNKDLLEAIRRTESRTGRLSRGGGDQELDRIAFEYVVAEACEVLHSQMETVGAHTDDANLQRAILRAYAVQAIATFADEDDSSDEEEEGQEEGRGYSSGEPERSPSPRLQRLQDMQHSNDTLQEQEEGGGGEGSPGRRSQSVDMARAGSVTPVPLSLARQRLQSGQQAQQAQQEDEQQAASASEQVSSSVLPDAPPDSALEDTAAQPPPQPLQAAQGREHGMQQAQQLPFLGQGFGLGHAGSEEQRQQAQHGTFPSLLPAQQGAPPQQADAAARDLAGAPQAQSSGLDDVMQQLSDAVDDMLRSPDAVSSRPRLLAPAAWGAGPGSQLHLPVPMQPSSQDSGTPGLAPALLEEVQQPLGGGVGGPAEPASNPQEQQGAPAGAGLLITPASGTAAAAAHPHPRLHYHPHRMPRSGNHPRQQPLPALQEEGGSARGGVEGRGMHATGARPPPHALLPQQLPPQDQHSGGSGSDGTQQSSDVQTEALKRQRTDGDEAAAILQQQQQRDPQPWGPQQVQQAQQQQQRDRQPWGPQQAQQAQQQQQQQQCDPQPWNPQQAQQAQQQQHEDAGAWPQLKAPGVGEARQLSTSPVVNASNAQEATSPLFDQLRAGEPSQQGQHVAAGVPAATSPVQHAQHTLRGSPQFQQQQQQQQGGADAVQHAAQGGAEVAEGSLETRGAARCGSSAWGSTLVCADLTLNDVASKYWPFLRSAMQGQGAAALQEDDNALVASLVSALGETIAGAYTAESGGQRPSPETKSLIAATAFDDMFRDKFAQESSGASK